MLSNLPFSSYEGGYVLVARILSAVRSSDLTGGIFRCPSGEESSVLQVLSVRRSILALAGSIVGPGKKLAFASLCSLV